MKLNSSQRFRNWLPVLIAAVFFIGCGDNGQSRKFRDGEQKSYSKEELLQINKKRDRAEERRISGYVKRSDRDFKKTETGLRYAIYEKGDESLPTAKEGQIAVMDFTVILLTGDTAYASTPGRPAEFMIGMDHVESGLHEGITYMRPGDKAELILPPHLAHGLVGDLNKIPMHATIVYDIALREVK